MLVLIGQKSRKHFGNFDKDDTTLDLDLRDLDKETVHQKTAGHDTFKSLYNNDIDMLVRPPHYLFV